jgi:hypothetical protein
MTALVAAIGWQISIVEAHINLVRQLTYRTARFPEKWFPVFRQETSNSKFAQHRF